MEPSTSTQESVTSMHHGSKQIWHHQMKEFQSKTAKLSQGKETTTEMNMALTMAQTTAPMALTMAQTTVLTMALTMALTGTKVMKETIGTAPNGKNNQVAVDLKERMDQKKLKAM